MSSAEVSVHCIYACMGSRLSSYLTRVLIALCNSSRRGLVVDTVNFSNELSRRMLMYNINISVPQRCEYTRYPISPQPFFRRYNMKCTHGLIRHVSFRRAPNDVTRVFFSKRPNIYVDSGFRRDVFMIHSQAYWYYYKVYCISHIFFLFSLEYYVLFYFIFFL